MMALNFSKAIVSDVRWTAATDRYPARVNFDIQGEGGRLSVSLPNASQQDYTNIMALQLEPVQIKSEFTVRRYNQDQYIELRAPSIVSLARPSVPEPAK